MDKEHAAMLRCNIEDGATGKVVRITGFSGHSAYVVRKIDVLPEVKGVVVVKIHLRLTDGKPSSSGDFDVQIPLIETLESIALAKPSDIIWTKPKK